MRRRAAPASPLTERHLCDRLRAAAGRFGALAYPEVSGWDVLLVLESGEQIGVQAKMRANIEVLAQAVRHAERGPGPDMRAVLVSDFGARDTHAREFRAVCDAARLIVWSALDMNDTPSGLRHFASTITNAPRWQRSARLWLPPLTDLPAGVPNPRSISRWRCNAAQLCTELRTGLTLTAAELTARDVGSLSTWTRGQRGWLVRVPGSSPARYGAADPNRLPDVKFPHVHAALGLPAPA